jgi:hypothetical protein
VSDEEHGGVYGTKFLLEDSVLRDTFATDYTLSELGGATLPDRYPQTVLFVYNKLDSLCTAWYI